MVSVPPSPGHLRRKTGRSQLPACALPRLPLLLRFFFVDVVFAFYILVLVSVPKE